MRYKDYGNTGHRVSAIGFGGMRFDMNRSIEENAELVQYAYEKGITYFDTAPGYCQDKSEDIFGKAFENMKGDFLVSTKAMPTANETAEKAKSCVKRSLERLGVDCIDFFHVWCLRKMAHYELAMQPGGMYEGLRECQEEGLIRHIVCSSHQPGKEIKQFIGKGEFDGILLGANLLNFPYRWDGVEAAYQSGCGVVAMNPLAGGSIPAHEKELSFLGTETQSPTEAALSFLVGCPQISVALVGFTSKEHIDFACQAADNATNFSDERLSEIRSHISSHMNAVCTGCQYCELCPKEIPVSSYMMFYNDKQLFGKSDETMIKSVPGQHDWGILAARKADAQACIECKACEEACTQHLPIVERLKEIAEWETKAYSNQSNS